MKCIFDTISTKSYSKITKSMLPLNASDYSVQFYTVFCVTKNIIAYIIIVHVVISFPALT